MISSVSRKPSPVPRPPKWLNSIEPRKPPASPVRNGWRWKKLPPAACAGAGEPGTVALGDDGDGLALRVIGAAPFCSKVRVPRLPMPDEDECPELEPPARASAWLGASTIERQKNSARAPRECEKNRVIAVSVRIPVRSRTVS